MSGKIGIQKVLHCAHRRIVKPIQLIFIATHFRIPLIKGRIDGWPPLHVMPTGPADVPNLQGRLSTEADMFSISLPEDSSAYIKMNWENAGNQEQMRKGFSSLDATWAMQYVHYCRDMLAAARRIIVACSGTLRVATQRAIPHR